MKICSYELGVLVWPALWNDNDDDNDDDARRGGASARMVPVFGGDMPSEGDEEGVEENGDDDDDDEENKAKYEEPRKQAVTVGWRMPYDLPLVPYGKDEKPWCATEACDEPDWMGRVWPGYGR